MWAQCRTPIFISCFNILKIEFYTISCVNFNPTGWDSNPYFTFLCVLFQLLLHLLYAVNSIYILKTKTIVWEMSEMVLYAHYLNNTSFFALVLFTNFPKLCVLMQRNINKYFLSKLLWIYSIYHPVCCWKTWFTIVLV